MRGRKTAGQREFELKMWHQHTSSPVSKWRGRVEFGCVQLGKRVKYFSIPVDNGWLGRSIRITLHLVIACILYSKYADLRSISLNFEFPLSRLKFSFARRVESFMETLIIFSSSSSPTCATLLIRRTIVFFTFLFSLRLLNVKRDPIDASVWTTNVRRRIWAITEPCLQPQRLRHVLSSKN